MDANRFFISGTSLSALQSWFERRRGFIDTFSRFLQDLRSRRRVVFFFFHQRSTNQFARAKREPPKASGATTTIGLNPSSSFDPSFLLLLRESFGRTRTCPSPCSPRTSSRRRSLLPRTPPVVGTPHIPPTTRESDTMPAAPTDARRDDTSTTTHLLRVGVVGVRCCPLPLFFDSDKTSSTTFARSSLRRRRRTFTFPRLLVRRKASRRRQSRRQSRHHLLRKTL